MNPPDRPRYLNISNLLSLSRIFLLIPMIYFLEQNTPAANWRAVFCMIVAGMTDWLDGYLSRRFHQESDFGRVVDPLADKITVGAIAIYLAVQRDFPLWFLLLILARDFAILTLGFFMASRLQVVPESDWFGKVAATGMAIMMVIYTLNATSFKIPLLMVCVGLVVLTIFSYVDRFLKALNEPRSGRRESRIDD